MILYDQMFLRLLQTVFVASERLGGRYQLSLDRSFAHYYTHNLKTILVFFYDFLYIINK